MIPRGPRSRRRISPHDAATDGLSFNWYRIAVKVPTRIGDFDTQGSRLEFETSIDDYAEVWVDGELPRQVAQTAAR